MTAGCGSLQRVHRVPIKNKPEVIFAITLKIVRHFHQILQVAAGMNAEQYVLELFTSPNVCTHTTL